MKYAGPWDSRNKLLWCSNLTPLCWWPTELHNQCSCPFTLLWFYGYYNYNMLKSICNYNCPSIKRGPGPIHSSTQQTFYMIYTVEEIIVFLAWKPFNTHNFLHWFVAKYPKFIILKKPQEKKNFYKKMDIS